VAKLYDMLPEGAGDSAKGRMAADNLLEVAETLSADCSAAKVALNPDAKRRFNLSRSSGRPPPLNARSNI
jgi:hypothetical protein